MTARVPGLPATPAGLSFRLPLLVLACLAGGTAPLHAQVEAEPILEGRVQRGDAPLDAGIVVLHRVSPDTAGEVDSVTVAENGTFRFRLPTVPDPGGRNEIYFASIRHHGVLYFGPPVTTAAELDSVYRIEVHDTASVPSRGADLPLSVRYMILERAGEDGGPGPGWRMTDLMQLHNPGDHTLVAGEGGTVWSHALPPAALSPRLGAGDLGPEAMSLDGGRLHVRGPIPPGDRQLLVRYELDGPELDIPLESRVETLELLVREPAPPLEVEGLEPGEPVQMEGGATYRRYLGAALAPGTLRIVPGDEDRGMPGAWVAVILAFLLAGAAGWVLLRDRGGVRSGAAGAGRGDAGPTDHIPPGADAADQREALLLEVARIDEALEGDGLEPDETARLQARRAALVARLAGRDAGA